MTLLEYITADPDDLGLPAMAEAGNDAGISEALNAPTIQNGLYITRDDFEVFVIGNGIAALARITATTEGTPLPLKVVCMSLGDVLSSSKFPKLRLDSASIVAMRGAFVQAGIMTQEQDDELLALGSHHMYSHAEAQEFSATTSEVSAALAPGRGL